MKNRRIFTAFAAFYCLSRVGAAGPVVNLTYASYQGEVQSDGITHWLGMRYAQPPLGKLRFAPPQDPENANSIQQATQNGKICLATGAPSNDTSTSEDCLFISVYAPSNATPSSKLPVFFFIQGGGFNTNSNPNLNGSDLIAAADNNLVFVTFNYRVGPYGFLAVNEPVNGRNVTIANNGLLDQRRALEWVQQHIANFGGDPDHVVLGGDSAGAASISLQLTAYGGNATDQLFHAAAAESISFATVLTVEEARYQFDNFVQRLNCTGNTTATSSVSAQLACLRSRTAAQLEAANTNIPYPGASAAPLYMWNPVIDGVLLQQLTYEAFATGNFLRVPLIAGDDSNGGTVFVPQTMSTLNDSDTFLHNQFPYLTDTQITQINVLYPNPNASACPAVGCYWRQASNAYGEMRYMCPGLYISSAIARGGNDGGLSVNVRDIDSNSTGDSNTTVSSDATSFFPSYAYRWDVQDPVQEAAGYGVPHTVEIAAIIGPNVSSSAPASYYAGGVNAKASPVVQAYWTSFIRTFDPNTYRYPGSAEWKPWVAETRLRMWFQTGGNTSMEQVDGALKMRCDYLSGIGASIRQ